jgi:hypothetical protein
VLLGGVQKEAVVGVPSCCRNSPVHKRGGAVVASAALTPSPPPRLSSPALPPAPCPQHFDRSWLAHATVKALLYDVEATVQVLYC